MENSQPYFLTLGKINGPHIDIMARPGYDKPVTVQDAIDIVADPRSVWKSIEDLKELLSVEQIEEFGSLFKLAAPSFYGYVPGNIEEDESITPVVVFFYYSFDMKPEEAMKLIEIHEKGALSPSLAVGLLAIAPSLTSKEMIFEGMVYGFVRVAGRTPAHGISYLSEKSIQDQVQSYLDALAKDGADIDAYLPACAVDRAKFMVRLAETVWNPDVRRKLSQAIKNMGTMFPVFLIATPWLYLNPDKAVQVSGINIPIKGNLGDEVDPWLQSLEWDSHQISADALKFLLPQKGEYIESFDFNFEMGYPQKMNAIAVELAKLLLEDTWTKPPLPPQNFRVSLPDFFYYEVSGMSYFRICGDVETGFWIGIETYQEISTSFWWQPQAEMPMGWVTGAMDDQLRSFIQLTLAAIWRDITHWRDTEFPYRNLQHYTGIQAYEWGRPEKIQRIREEVRRIMKDSNIKLWELPASEAAQALYNLALNAFSVQPKILGRACLALLMQFCDPDLGGF